MKSTTVVITSLLASISVVIAQPHRHQHAARHHKRDETVVWVTDIDYVTETVDVTTTIWVSEGFVPPTATEASTTPSSSASPSAASSSSGVPVQFFQPDTTPAATSTTFSSVYVAPTPTTPVSVPPTTASAEPIPTTTSTTPIVVAAPAPVETSSSSTPVAAPVVSVAAAEAAPAVVEPTTSPAAPVATTAAAPVDAGSSSSSSGSSSYGAETSGCKEGAACTGDITYYQAGLGACGITSDGDTQNVVALPHALMGTQSNGNPYCGQTITIQCPLTGETTTATVVDKCMGCTGFSIDLSNAAFLDLASLAVGRTTANWWFN